VDDVPATYPPASARPNSMIYASRYAVQFAMKNKAVKFIGELQCP
jgi:hypothetical protein